jgi:hypothetical protein
MLVEDILTAKEMKTIETICDFFGIEAYEIEEGTFHFNFENLIPVAKKISSIFND